LLDWINRESKVEEKCRQIVAAWFDESLAAEYVADCRPRLTQVKIFS
jgi:hypothetical protein